MTAPQKRKNDQYEASAQADEELAAAAALLRKAAQTKGISVAELAETVDEPAAEAPPKKKKQTPSSSLQLGQFKITPQWAVFALKALIVVVIASVLASFLPGLIRLGAFIFVAWLFFGIWQGSRKP
jgi:anti-sigma factor RsiW